MIKQSNMENLGKLSSGHMTKKLVLSTVSITPSSMLHLFQPALRRTLLYVTWAVPHANNASCYSFLTSLSQCA